ncbi:MAG: endonuclease/exonuclease/phosphatase family protein [Bacteroidales bacterium]
MKYIVLLAFTSLLLAASCDKDKPSGIIDPNPHYRVMFYNVENLFDAINDPLINDEEFLPGSTKKWTEGRYQEKIDHIARVIKDLGNDTLPVLVGLCEVENRKTVDDLINKTILKGLDYQVIHHESPDSRGIDVALLYRSGYFQLLDSHFYPIKFPFDTAVRTREILYACGIIGGKDTLHVFVNHWPSRSSGEVQTRPLRLWVAEAVKYRVDCMLRISPKAQILITGDLNDEPMDLSVVSGLNAILAYDRPEVARLYDLTQGLKSKSPGGTYKYKGTWNLLDHMVVSGAVLDTARLLYARPADLHVFQAKYLLEKDKTNMGEQPLRTYLGNYYQGGYSDHLPVYLDLHYRR